MDLLLHSYINDETVINKKDLKILWARSAGRCSFPECKLKLIIENPETSDQIIGEVAHIIAKSQKGPRGIPDFNPEYLNSYENLILLCPNHHRLIDSFPEKYKSEILKEMKHNHEIRIREILTDFDKEGIGWKVIIQENGQRIDQTEIKRTLELDFIDGEIIKLEEKGPYNSWVQAKKNLESKITELLQNPNSIRFAIFSLAKISSAIHLGYLLSNRISVRYAQYDRDNQIWDWPTNFVENYSSIKTSRLMNKINKEISEFIVKVSLSAKINNRHLTGLEIPIDNAVDIYIEDPMEDWLKSELQVIEVGRKFREVLRNLREFTPNLKTIHLFYAGPTSCAIAIGQQINPSMNPIIQLYEFDYRNKPYYSKSIRLGD